MKRNLERWLIDAYRIKMPLVYYDAATIHRHLRLFKNSLQDERFVTTQSMALHGLHDFSFNNPAVLLTYSPELGSISKSENDFPEPLLISYPSLF